MKKKWAALLLAAVCMTAAVTGCGIKKAAPEITIDDISFKIREDSLGSVLEQGLVVRGTNGQELTEFPTYGGRELWYQDYELARPADGGPVSTGVTVQLVNVYRNEMEAPDCRIYKAQVKLYDAAGAPAASGVLVSGVDFHNLSREEGIAAMETLKLTPDKDVSTQAKVVFDVGGRYRYTLVCAAGPDGAQRVTEVGVEQIMDVTPQSDADGAGQDGGES